MTMHHAGEVIADRYEVVRFIGQGGMQEVYEAQDNILIRRVALKCPKTISANRRFARSAATAAKINHANVAKTLDYIPDTAHPFLIEEVVDGCDLSEFMKEHVPTLDPYSCAQVIHRLAKGLAASHHAGVVHRDIKPSNIMVVGGAAFTDVKITDFGIAKMAEVELDHAVNGGEEALTQSATALGALPYMAPEMIESFTDAGRAADVWSLGAMAFELLTSKKPFGAGYRAVPLIQAAVMPTLPRDQAPKAQFAALTNQIYDIIRTCLSRDPSVRPTADGLVTQCEALCYSDARRQYGFVDSFNHRDDGFIRTDSGGSVFFHQNSVPYGRVEIGQRVWFSRHHGAPRDRAFPVVRAR
ncbi:serine/threonine-protein kinase [Azorhizobium doebereinerae]|uniref:serine/threonine-protein kinase n=1 Tax=Azorhizobium doebereinerae TaxID=281091 RepID=UPI0018DD6808|nr:serine/threonine-protein kinase [Azorhizobium doebereinerae]